MLNIKDQTHFFNPKFRIVHHIKKKPPEQVKVYDKLFYTIYHKLNESKLFMNKYNETLEKIKVIEQLDSIAIKHKNKLLDDLQTPNIQLFSLYALTQLWNINIVWFSDYCYHDFIVDADKPIYYLSHLYVWTDNPILKYKLLDIFKPIKSMSYYKLDELKEIALCMNINGKTKKDYYDQIIQYFKHIKLI